MRYRLRGLGAGLLLAWITLGSLDCGHEIAPTATSTHLPDDSTSSAGAASVCAQRCAVEGPVADCDGDGVQDADDCAPCDPKRSRLLVEDADGDAVRSRILPNGPECTVVPATISGVGIFPPDYDLDCDDGDPTLFQYVCLDADQDGLCAPNTDRCVGQEIPAGYRRRSNRESLDCDDSSPTRQRDAFYDEDGDGDNSATPSACVGALDPNAFPLGSSGSDCDDQDPTVSCAAVDLLADGRDTNCDGDDGSLQCSQLSKASALCPCWPRDTCRVTTTCSDRPDLNIVDVEPARSACWQCSRPYRQDSTGLQITIDGGGNASALLVNSGGAVFEGSVVVGDWNSKFPSLTTALRLAPGENRIFDLSQMAGSVKIEVVSGDDCLSENNSAEIPLGIPMCGD